MSGTTDKRDPRRFRRAEDAERAHSESAQLADAAMALLGCVSADDVYRVMCDFLSLIAPEAILIVNEVSADQGWLITRKVAGIEPALLSQAADIFGFEAVGKRWALLPEYGSALLSGTLSRSPNGLAELARHEIPRAIADAGAQAFGIHDVYTLGIADGHDILASINVLRRTSDAGLPIHVIESFAHHCYSTLAAIRASGELVKEATRSSLLVESLIEGLALHEIILDDHGVPCDYRFLDVNPAFEMITGLKAGDIVGRTVLEVMPDTEPSWIERYGVVATTGVAARFDDYSGALGRHYEVTAYSPAPLQFATLVSDVTLRVRTQDELAQSRSMLKEILDTVPQSIFWKDTRGVYLGCNRVFAETAGVGVPESVIGRTDFELPWPTEEAEAYREADAQIIEHGVPRLHIVEPLQRENGTRLWVDTTKLPLRDERGGLVGVLGVVEDITEGKLVEQELQTSRDMLLNLTAQVPGVVYQYLLRPDGSSAFPFSSRGMQDIYEYDPDEVREDATPVFGRLHPDDYDDVAAAIQESARTLEPFHCEFRVVLPRQGLRWRLSDAVPQRTDDGGTLWHGIISDITDRKQAEQELRDVNTQLEAMVYGVAEAMGRVVEMRDPYTQGHDVRVAEIAGRLAAEMGLSSDEIAGIEMAGLIHDIGKLGVPAEILNKPGVLSVSEFALIREHPTSGFEIVKDIAFPWPVAESVLQHHERMDGSGYPQGLSGDQICRGARILAVADIIEAMASHRPYRPALGIEDAIEEIVSHSERFDPDVVAACLKLHRTDADRLVPAR